MAKSKRTGSLQYFICQEFLRVLLIIPLLVQATRSQELPIQTDDISGRAVKLFVDCQRCDQDYFRSEIGFVDFVRDRADAQVHLLISTQTTGGGGTEHTLTFFGKQNFLGIDDTLKFVSRKDDTDEIIRSGLARLVKLGLIRYVAKTSVAEHLSIRYNLPTESRPTADPWDNWVFSLSVNGNFNGQSSYGFQYLYGSITVRRVTPFLKIRQSLFLSYNQSSYDLSGRTILNLSRGKGYNGQLVWSVGEHWGVGMIGGVSSSTYSNTRLATRLAPAFEYNLFPYSESTRRQFRIQYSLVGINAAYLEETLYDRLRELRAQQELVLSLEMVEPWGSSDISLTASHYMHDARKYQVGLSGDLSIRIVSGLSLRLSGNYSRVRDQLSLPRRGASDEEVLLQRRQIETQYYYWGSVGISYSFGSIYNNVVNARFGN